ncbi:glycosyltransferase family 2 protein [Tellurirhabdus bombi]|uniref:glycosyltransferase family 2 protein n=1 Tax=Tellurirhabdus bombi TaxID=2907205 RepID=UPI001F373933|nr:glycosyltransferase family 2 protein [Tellurirhabdus bombi]
MRNITIDSTSPFLSVIIPCYNEEQVLLESYTRLSQVMQANFQNYELIFINDGSCDRTLSILKKLALEDKCLKILSFSRNFGHQPAVSAGIKNCSGDLAIILDADLQDPPELIPDMVNLYQNSACNVVYAVRKRRAGETFFKKFTARLFYRTINKLSEVNLPLDTGDFRLIDRKVINAFNQLPERNKYIRGLISWVGFKQVPFVYSRNERFAGTTKYPLWKMIKFARTSLLYFSHKPLQIASSLGVVSVAIALLLLLWVIYNNIFLPQSLVQGWSSTIIVVMFFGGIQMLTIGILGEYLSNVFDEIKKRPEYIIDEKLNLGNEIRQDMVYDAYPN